MIAAIWRCLSVSVRRSSLGGCAARGRSSYATPSTGITGHLLIDLLTNHGELSFHGVKSVLAALKGRTSSTANPDGIVFSVVYIAGGACHGVAPHTPQNGGGGLRSGSTANQATRSDGQNIF